MKSGIRNGEKNTWNVCYEPQSRLGLVCCPSSIGWRAYWLAAIFYWPSTFRAMCFCNPYNVFVIVLIPLSEKIGFFCKMINLLLYDSFFSYGFYNSDFDVDCYNQFLLCSIVYICDIVSIFHFYLSNQKPRLTRPCWYLAFLISKPKLKT